MSREPVVGAWFGMVFGAVVFGAAGFGAGALVD